MERNLRDEATTISHFDDHIVAERIIEAFALVAPEKVSGNRSIGGEDALDVGLFSRYPLAPWADRGVVDLSVCRHQASQHVLLTLDELCAITGLHLLEVHEESILGF